MILIKKVRLRKPQTVENPSKNKPIYTTHHQVKGLNKNHKKMFQIKIKKKTKESVEQLTFMTVPLFLWALLKPGKTVQSLATVCIFNAFWMHLKFIGKLSHLSYEVERWVYEFMIFRVYEPLVNRYLILPGCAIVNEL